MYYMASGPSARWALSDTLLDVTGYPEGLGISPRSWNHYGASGFDGRFIPFKPMRATQGESGTAVQPGKIDKASRAFCSAQYFLAFNHALCAIKTDLRGASVH